MDKIPFLRAQLLATGLFGLTGVGFGAYGAHGLKNKVPADRQAAFVTAAHYQIVHSCVMAGSIALKVALIASGMKSRSSAAVKALDAAVGLFAAGIFGFSFSIYWLTFGGPRAIAPVTPAGGFSLMFGWAALAATGLLL